MTRNALPSAGEEVAAAFAKPTTKAASLRMPPARQKPARKPIQAVPDPSEDPESQTTAHHISSAPQTDPQTFAGPTPAASAPTTVSRPRRGRPPNATTPDATSAPGRPAAGDGTLVLWTPTAIRARMQTQKSADGTRYLNQVLDALEGTYHQLDDLVDKATQPTRVQGPLFERLTPSAPDEPEHRVQLTIRGFLSSQLKIIDDLVDRTGAGSRSALVNTALDAHLP